MRKHPEHWQDIRIGGSDAATVMNANPWSNPLELWQIKLGIIPRPDLSDNLNVKRGIQFEEIVIQDVLDELGIGKIDPDKREVAVSNEAGDKVGYLDYQIDDKTFIEAKTTTAWNKKWNEGVPEYNYWQIVHYFHCMPSAKVCYAACMIGGYETKIYEIHRNEEHIAMLVKAEDAFLEMIRTGTMPPTPELPDEPEGATYNMETQVAQLCEMYLDAHEQASYWDKLKKEYGAALRDSVGDGNEQIGAFFKASFKASTKKSFDKARLFKDYPDIKEDDYTTKSTTYRISIGRVKQ